MQKKLLDFASSLGLALPEGAAQKLAAYADLIWEKKDFLNLTSVGDKEEIFTRHLCDGLAGAAFCARAVQKESFTAADMGAGAGYIGLTLAAALPQARVSLVESLEKRCAFLNWVILKLGLTNAAVVCVRLGQKPVGTFDFVTERAMGRLNDILPLIAPAVKPGGLFAAYQSCTGEADGALVHKLGLREEAPQSYRLPGEDKTRWLAVFGKSAAAE